MQRFSCYPHSVVLLSALIIWTGCNNEPPHPAPDRTEASPYNGVIDTAATLSEQMRSITTLYAQIDTSVAAESDSSFIHALDSAARVLSTLVHAGNDPVHCIGFMNRCIFEQWGITFCNDRNNVRYLLPHLVWKEKKGSCVGMSLLYLLLAEKAGLPLYAVRAPSHLFVRYNDGLQRFNIETLRRGESMDDAWYRQRYSIVDTMLYTLQNLDKTGVAAVVAYNLGTVCLNRNCSDNAVRFLQYAIAAFPDFPEAKGNLALAFEAAGKYRQALGLLLELRRAHPSLEQIDRTIASLQLQRGEYRNALISFDTACKKVPDDPEVHFGRAMALFRLHRFDEAEAALDRVIRLRPGYPEAEKLRLKIRR